MKNIIIPAGKSFTSAGASRANAPLVPLPLWGQRGGSPNATRGFTLIELMIVVSILAVLAALALTSFQKQALRANRVECVGAMMAESGKLERAYSFTRDYGKVYSGTLNDSKLTSCPLDTNGSTSANKQTYTVTVNSTKTTYTIVAIPIGRQAQDSCGGLALTHLGEKKSGVSDSTGASAAHNNDAIAAACWR